MQQAGATERRLLPIARPGWGAAILRGAEGAMLAQRGHLFPWIAVAFGAGIGVWFALPADPPPHAHAMVAFGALLALALVRPLGAAWGPLALGLAVGAAGFSAAGAQAHLVAAPVLDGRYYGPITGRIVDVDRSASDALRLTLDRVVLADRTAAETPVRVRVALHGDQRWLDPMPGTVVILTGHLAPPNGPVEPGDFDFRMTAWFAGLGAVGYTRSPVLTLLPPEEGAGLRIAQIRITLSEAVRALIPGDAGGLAAAVMTGDRSGLSIAASDAMRDANLYHLVSISGMHMGMLVAFVFGLVRTTVALIPPLALRIPAKKVAAAVALPVAAFYLALAGRDVATERAFVMAAVMLGAILLDRQALTMRSVALAALIVLALRPESLLNPGFQMSFAAVIALIFAFSLIGAQRAGVGARWRWLLPLGLLLFSSLIAGLATAPFAAAHFNRIAHYGLIANLLAVPVMGLVVMPGAVILALLGPLGLTEPARTAIDLGCRWILAVSEWIAATDGAVSAVAAPPPAVLPLIAAGALVAILWRGRGRAAGAVPLLLAAVLWLGSDRPAVLVAASGGIVGIMTPEGRALSRAEGEGFVAENWLENDGSVADQASAAGRAAFAPAEAGVMAEVAGTRILVVRGVRAAAALAGCGGADLVVSDQALDGPRPCRVLDADALAATGAVAGHLRDGVLTLTTATEAAGGRMWTRAP